MRRRNGSLGVVALVVDVWPNRCGLLRRLIGRRSEFSAT